jgi:crotonobetainyl-CoA:carnitine CoA-transferase CaiB-like acyl-CoA transferase
MPRQPRAAVRLSQAPGKIVARPPKPGAHRSGAERALIDASETAELREKRVV